MNEIKNGKQQHTPIANSKFFSIFHLVYDTKVLSPAPAMSDSSRYRYYLPYACVLVSKLP